MKDTLLKRSRECAALGLVWQGEAFVKEDFNIHWTELTCDTDEEWNEKIRKIRAEMERRDNAR